MPEGQGHLEPGGRSSQADTAAPRMAPTCHNTQQCKHHANQNLGEPLFQAGSVAAPGGRVDLPGLSQTQSQKDSTSLSKMVCMKHLCVVLDSCALGKLHGLCLHSLNFACIYDSFCIIHPAASSKEVGGGGGGEMTQC